MNTLFPIKVKCYSGHKADETPLSFIFHDMKFEIIEVTDRWYQAEYSPNTQPANYFKVKTKDRKNFMIKHQKNTDEWFLLVHGETIHL
ncbi:cytoplasmic protein [Marinilabilia rubra]|uniref:Cytoplasmic protein n=1 Tax=Marinilabilia rubra TaxID=2162893 RepID=A0A2U2B3T8_9BACT|nr:cytoplasmic protein [Marinilabilia rubra]PWD97719.1 cytoplasmic protein [Marinilabilia rubra]